MAGVFGFFNYAKPGKGVDKNAPEKKRFFVFCELFVRKFWKLIQLNLLFLLFSIPIVTIAPAFVAMCKVMKEIVNERGVFLFSDYLEAFKKNFKQSFLFGLITLVVTTMLAYTLYFYFQNSLDNIPMIILFGFAACFSILWMLINYYMATMIPILDMKLRMMFKNAVLLSIVGLKTNIVTIIFVTLVNAAIIVVSLMGTIPMLICMVLFFTLSFSWTSFLIVFNCYPIVNKFVIDPYYEETGEQRPDQFYYDEEAEFDDIIFADIGTQEKAMKVVSNKNKKIK